MITVREMLSQHISMFTELKKVRVLDVRSNVKFTCCGSFLINISDSQCRYMLDLDVVKWEYNKGQLFMVV